MKKKRILLGLALTAAAALSLASCGGKDKKASSTAATSSVVASSAATSSTATSSAAKSSAATSSAATSSAAAQSSAAASSAATSSAAAQSSAAASSAAASSAVAQSSTAAESSAAASSATDEDKCTVTFYADVEATSVLKTVEVELGEAAGEAPEFTGTVPTGKKFDKWVYKSNSMNYSATDLVAEDLAVIPSFVDLGIYDTLVADADNLVYNEDFSTATAGTTASELPTDLSAAKGYFTEKAGTDCGATIALQNNSNALQTVDTGSNTGSAVVLFGEKIEAATVKAYVEVSTKGTGSKWQFLQLITITDEGSLSTKFAIGENGDKKMAYGDGSVWAQTFRNETYSSNETFKLYFEIDLSTGNLSVTNTKSDGTKEVICDNYAAGITSFAGFRSVTGGKATDRVVTLDNIAVTAEKVSVADYQTAKKTALKAEYDTYTATDYSTENYAAITAIYNTAVTDIEAATTTSSIDSILSKAISDMDAVKTSLEVAQENAITDITSYATTKKSGVTDEVANAVDAVVAEYTAKINAAKTTDEITELTTAAETELDYTVASKFTMTFTALLADGTAVAATIDSIEVADGYSAEIAGIKEVKVSVGNVNYKVVGYYTAYTTADATDNEAFDTTTSSYTGNLAIILVVEKIEQEAFELTGNIVATQLGATSTATAKTTADTVITGYPVTIGNGIEVQYHQKSYGSADDPEFASDYRIKLPKKGSTTSGFIKVTISGACTLNVYGMSGSKGTTRPMVIANAAGTALATENNDGTALGKATVAITTAGDYYIYTTADGGVNIYGIVVTID